MAVGIKKVILAITLAVLLVGIGIFMTISTSTGPGVTHSDGAAQSQKVAETDLGSGYINPQVVNGGRYFVASTVNYGVLTLNLIDPRDGREVDTGVVARDVDTAFYRIAYDAENDEIMVLWLNGTHMLNYTYVTDIGTGRLGITNHNYSAAPGVICDRTFVGLASDDHGHFFASFVNNSGYTFLVPIDASGPLSPIQVSSTGTTSHDFVALDDSSGNIIVLWKNDTGSNGAYDIVFRIYDNSFNPITPEVKLAKSVGLNIMVYGFPSAEGGPGKFFVAAANHNTVNDSYLFEGWIVNSDGTVDAHFGLGYTSQYGMSIPGVDYNNTDFIVAWTDKNYDIVSRPFATDGTPAGNITKIKESPDSEEWQDVAANSEAGAFYFVWYDYSNKHDYGALWLENEYVPELGAMIPVFIAILVALVVWKRR